MVLGIAEWRGEIDDDMRNTSHAKFLVMASCDGLAGFLAAMGAVHTSGAMQQLLNQTLIPFTMLMSFILLGKMSSTQHIIGSGVILLGVGVVLAPHIFGNNTEPIMRHSHTVILVSSIVYCLSNLPFAVAFVYKEFGFKDLNIHPIHLTQWVSVYQCIIGFLVMPLQMILASVREWYVIEAVRTGHCRRVGVLHWENKHVPRESCTIIVMDLLHRKFPLQLSGSILGETWIVHFERHIRGYHFASDSDLLYTSIPGSISRAI